MSKKPNVIVFFTDQQRWDSVGLHGNPMQLTPNFDRLAKAGMFVPNSFTCQPVCGPARSAMQTGKYPTTTGCFSNSIPLPKDEKTLAHYFREAGYHTGYIGKWHLAGQEPVPEEERGGYQSWLASNILEFTSYAYDAKLYNENNELVKLPGYRVDALTDAAIRYIAEEREEPFFLYVSYLEPHHQNQTDDYPAPVGYAEAIEKNLQFPEDLKELGGNSQPHYAGYMGMIKRLDEALGRLTDALISLDMLDDTIILFTSDHGCHFKTRNSEYKRSCHEASIRVPTFFSGPAFKGKGAFDGLASLIDLPPTLLDAAGITVPAAMQGHSLLSPESEAAFQDIFVQISEDHIGRALRTRRWKYEVGAPELDAKKVMDSPTYIETHLYDLDNDPHELVNLVHDESYKTVRHDLRQILLKRLSEAGENQPDIISRPALLSTE
ncbi:sulfatase-like hydrolase/transferase [Pseudochrobactrum sp. MP213Fo]|uniref:sulfatase-like hydrolase/transferase n=1 Tax=Pseudochrobactrum sp. MP213Fo TaxID=3022250 RepID=UPI003BA3BFAA